MKNKKEYSFLFFFFVVVCTNSRNKRIANFLKVNTFNYSFGPHRVSMEMAATVSSLGTTTLISRGAPAPPRSRRSTLSQRPYRWWKTRRRRKRKKRREMELGRRPAVTKGSLRTKGKRREARIWKLLWPPPPRRAFIFPIAAKWTPIDPHLGTDRSRLLYFSLPLLLCFMLEH